MAGIPSLAEQAAALAADAKEVAELAAVGKKRIPHVGDIGDMSALAWRRQQACRAQETGIPRPPTHSYISDYFEVRFGDKHVRQENRVSNNGRNFNVKAVAQVLVEEGYDPTVDVVKILRGRPDPEAPEDDPDRRIYSVGSDVRLRFAAELMKFVHPTKKAVEVEDKTPPLGGRALDARLSALIQQYVTIMGGTLPPEVVEALAAVGGPPPAEEPFDPYSLL